MLIGEHWKWEDKGGVKGQEVWTQAMSGFDLMITFLWFLSKLKYSVLVSLKKDPPLPNGTFPPHLPKRKKE